MKRPSFQFYPGDWMNDPALRMCSLGARGLWSDMMAIMHDCEPYGHLVVNGKGILPPILARRVGASLEETEGFLAELREHGVFSISSEGWIYSRRMVRDEHNRQVRAVGGVKSLENPNVPRPKHSEQSTEKDTFRPSPPSSSASPSSSPKKYPEDFEAAWREYPRRSGANSKADAYRAYRARLRGGSTATEILEGVRRYRAYVQNAGNEGTEYVKMASTFFGPGRHYEEDWSLRPLNGAKPKAVVTTTDAAKGTGLLLIGELRSKRVHHAAPQGSGVYVIPRPEYDSLPQHQRRAVDAIGGLHKIANAPDEQFPILASQFAQILTAAQKPTTEDAVA